MSLIDTVLNAVFPNRCVGCNEIIDKGEYLCDYCYEMLPKTAESNCCKVCGNIKSSCFCKKHVFHFTSATAPFFNEGTAKQIMYAFKFRRKLYFADFLSTRMALSVRTEFYGVPLDSVAYVPMPAKRELKRGYNQSRELALRIAKLLELPLVENAIGCNEKRNLQYQTGLKDRFKNVKGVFYPNLSLKGRRILLVDDIKTTGATLDECSRALLKAGVEEVYCVTGLISSAKKKEGKFNGN